MSTPKRKPKPLARKMYAFSQLMNDESRGGFGVYDETFCPGLDPVHVLRDSDIPQAVERMAEAMYRHSMKDTAEVYIKKHRPDYLPRYLELAKVAAAAVYGPAALERKGGK